MIINASQSCDDATELQQRERDTMTSKKHLLFLLLTILRKRLKLLLLRLFSSAFACSNHYCVSVLLLDVKRRGKQGKGTGQTRGGSKAGKGSARGAGESGESYEDVCCCGCSIWKRRAGAGVRKRELGPGARSCSPSRVEGLFCYWLVG